MSIGPNHRYVLAIPIDARSAYPSFSAASVWANVAPLSRLIKWKSEQVLKACRTLFGPVHLITRGKRGALAGAPRVGFVHRPRLAKPSSTTDHRVSMPKILATWFLIRPSNETTKAEYWPSSHPAVYSTLTSFQSPQCHQAPKKPYMQTNEAISSFEMISPTTLLPQTRSL